MSEERFDRIDEELGQVKAGLDRVEGRLGGVEGRLDRVEGRLGGIEGRLDKLEAGHDELKVEMHEMKADLKHEMRILHEDVIDRIKATQTDGPSRTEFREGLADIRETFARRLDPLEAAVRYFIEKR